MPSNLIVKEFDFQDTVSETFLTNYPVVYILYNENEIYVGETTNINRRIQEHKKDESKKDFTKYILIGHEKFHQSATLNIETNLINNFIGDEIFKLLNKTQTSSDYYNKSFYNNEITEELWNEKLKKLPTSIANKDLETIQNQEIYKLSPFHGLSEEQLDIKEQIIQFCEQSSLSNLTQPKIFLIKGNAGTGKSIVLSSLYKDLCDLTVEDSNLKGSEIYLLVNNPQIIQVYKNIAKLIPNIKSGNIQRPTPFINSYQNGKIKNSDIILIDEAHLLLSSEDNYNNSYCENQLKEILTCAKIVIIIFDSKQVIKLKSHWSEESINNILNPYKENTTTFELKEQFRMKAPKSVIDWIHNFINKKLTALPSTEQYTFKIYETPNTFKEEIKKLNDQEKLSRIVATFDYEHHKDGGTYIVDAAGLNLPWNSVNDKSIWIQNESSIEEVGSIYTVQGFDLNHVGVFLGPSVKYDSVQNEIVIDITAYEDSGAFKS